MVVFNDAYYRNLRAALGSAHSKHERYQAIVDTPFLDKLTAVHLGLGIVVLLLVDEKSRTLNRIALSNTEAAHGAVRMTSKPFHEIKIPLGYSGNIITQVVNEGTPQQTTDWQDLFAPELTPQEARFNQAGAGIEVSAVYPLTGGCQGALIFSYYEKPQAIMQEHHAFMRNYSAIASEFLRSGT